MLSRRAFSRSLIFSAVSRAESWVLGACMKKSGTRENIFHEPRPSLFLERIVFDMIGNATTRQHIFFCPYNVTTYLETCKNTNHQASQKGNGSMLGLLKKSIKSSS